MLIVNKLIAGGQGLAPALLKRATKVVLPWDLRCRSRFDAADDSGRVLGFFLPRGAVVRGGDVAVAEDGSLVQIVAAPQAVLVVRACSEHGTPRDLLRAAYHLANRHVPLELQADHLKLEPDHVLAEMLRAMHLKVSEEEVAFEPEGGAYTAAAHAHAPGHAHGHGHQHDHGHAHAVAHADPAPTAHVHGPGCGHDHGHGD